MKKFTKILTLAMSLVLCVSLLAACTGGEENPTTTQKPGTSTTTKPESDKNEGSTNKPSASKPAQTQPSESKPEQTQPTETKPSESKPENGTTESTAPSGK